MTDATVLTAIEDAVRASGLVPVGGGGVVAVSGGADSTALLGALHALAPEWRLRLTVAHFDHRLRDGSARDAERVGELARSLGFPFRAAAGDVRARARARRETLEVAGRHLRYAFLEEAAGGEGADFIATGHTRDDQVETVLMRMLRGAGVRGLAGIPARRGAIVRPLLAVTHAQTRAYCAARALAYADDPSNVDRRFARNRIRHDVLPALRAAAPGAEEALLRLQEQAARALDVHRRTIAAFVPRALAREGAEGWILDARAIAPLDDVARYVLFADLIAERGGAHASRGVLERLIALSAPGARSGRVVGVPSGSVRREHDTLVFRPAGAAAWPAQERPAGAVALAVPGVTRAHGARFTVEVLERAALAALDWRSGESGGAFPGGVAYFAAERLAPPLRVRTRIRGDRMRSFGMRGHKKLSDILVDRKVPLRRREGALVVEDAREILWLVGVATSESGRVDEGCRRVLRVRVEAAQGPE
ncbi:MAG: tRNA lysidine(34) synthetase TilS [Candidatus Krumholzibacteria bacterium]|nr:tRNA lysidine(34) synthetase TilS [Candidatus Krumholzibacteria bacterium]